MRPAHLFLEEEMKLEAQGENAEVSEAGANHPSRNGPGSSSIQQSHTLAIERSGSSVRSNSKATGPRTRQGKQKSSRNATKHGVFSKVIILNSKPKAEYEELLTGLRETLQPEGELEELLVEKLATTTWRQRRLLLAESAEIQKNMEFVESDQRDREHEEAERFARILAPFNNQGLIRNIQNPHVLERCLELLVELREQVEKDGLSLEFEKAILGRIYGDRDENRLQEDLYDDYLNWMVTAEVSEEERVREAYASPEHCRKRIAQGIDEEIRRLKRDQKVRAAVQTARTQLEIVSRNVADGPGLDRLLRYEASLERSFDRTLSQLERLQRMRLGQPVLPKLEVRHSLS